MDAHDKAVTVIEKNEVDRMHPVVRAALAQAPDVATLGELLKLQREHEAAEARRAYTSAIVDLKRDLPTVIKRDAKVGFGSGKGATHYTHSSLAEVMDAVTGPLTRHGFSLSWVPSTNERGVSVVCRITHAQGHSESCEIQAPADKSGSKGAAQGVASTITMLQRYTALALLGIATRDMKDPSPEPEPDSVDPAQNAKAVTSLRKVGKSKADAEERLGVRFDAWSAGNLEILRKWYAELKHGDVGPPAMTEEDGAAAVANAEAVEREPGQDG